MPNFEIGTHPFEQFQLDCQLSADQSGFEKPAKAKVAFQTSSESETAKHEFLARCQHKEENPMLYLLDNIT